MMLKRSQSLRRKSSLYTKQILLNTMLRPIIGRRNHGKLVEEDARAEVNKDGKIIMVKKLKKIMVDGKSFLKG